MSTDVVALAPSLHEHPETGVAAPLSPERAVEDVGTPAPLKKTKTHHGPRKASRVKPPKDSKVYKVSMATIALRAQGVRMPDIAEQLGYDEHTIRQYLYYANKRGWINHTKLSDPEDQLDFVIKTKVVRNVNEALDERDKVMTIEAAKGLGLFKTHQVSKTDGNTSVGLALRVDVQMPAAATTIAIRPGTIGGERGMDIPIDAEVINEKE